MVSGLRTKLWLPAPEKSNAVRRRDRTSVSGDRKRPADLACRIGRDSSRRRAVHPFLIVALVSASPCRRSRGTALAAYARTLNPNARKASVIPSIREGSSRTSSWPHWLRWH